MSQLDSYIQSLEAQNVT
jgi:hypothetical protein